MNAEQAFDIYHTICKYYKLKANERKSFASILRRGFCINNKDSIDKKSLVNMKPPYLTKNDRLIVNDTYTKRVVNWVKNTDFACQIYKEFVTSVNGIDTKEVSKLCEKLYDNE